MAGNKALEKFKNSKIPKKGTATIPIEIPIYKEPNTHSPIIGKIKKDEEITWISKSICDEREWIRCNQINDYGYIVGYEKDGRCNLDINTIKENKEEIKKEYGFEQKNEIIPITKEEIKLGDEALKEILNDEDDFIKKDNNNNDSNINTSTENDESQKSDLSKLNDGKSQTSDINIKQDDWDDFFEDDINKIDEIKLINEKLINEIADQYNKEESENKNNDKNNSVIKAICSLEKDTPNEEKSKVGEMLKDLPVNKDNFIKNLSSTIIDIIPGPSNIKNFIEAFTGKDLITNEKLGIGERIISGISSIPGAGNAVKLGFKATKAVKNVVKSEKVIKNITKSEKEIKKLSNPQSFHDPTKNAAFRRAKRNNDIPMNQQPNKVTPDHLNRQGKKEKGREYDFGNGKKIRHDQEGHKFDDGEELPGHFNDQDGNHYYYDK